MVLSVTAVAALRAITTILAVWLVAAALPAKTAVAQSAGPDVLRLPLPQYDGGLTPYTFELGYPLVTLVYDTLMWRDAAGIPRPWLARRVQRSRGDRRITIQLRDDARWHDGRAVTAEDVAFTFRYVAGRPHPRFTPQLADVERVRASGRLTVVIDLRRPSLGFEDQPLADLPILPRHLWRDLPAGRRAPAGLAVGSGPYRLTRARPADGYVLRANERYFRGTPRVAQLRVPIIPEAEEQYAALRQRRVDMVPLSLPRRAAMELDSALGLSVRRGPSYLGTALVFNVRRAPFEREAARRAVAAALDLRLIERNVAPAEPALGGFLHPSSRWGGRARVHESDPAAARRALDALGLPTIRVLSPENDPVRSEAARQVVLALRRVGATATVVDQSPDQLSRALGEDGSTPDFDAAITSIPSLVSHDPNYLRALFGSDPQIATLNVTGYRSEAFDEAARAVAAARQRGARQRAVLEELRVLARAAPAVPLFFSQGAFAFRPAVYGGWTFHRGTGILDKRSFLPSPLAGAVPPDAAAIGDQPDDGGSVFDVVNVISLLLLAGIVVLAVYALLQRRRS